ncbi:MAG: DNA-binding protein [Clostridia bacterium]|nr:DNA-binding protein [Clostridia bacterium]
MFEKNMKIAYLLDFYEDLLDEHVRSVMRAYYDDDLSLAEIASGEGISRQGIRHLIKKGEDAIEFYESNLALAKRHEELLSACASLSSVCARLEKEEAFVDDVTEIRRVIEVITKGNQDVPKFN